MKHTLYHHRSNNIMKFGEDLLLTPLYHKTSGKSCPLGAVHLNEVISDLTWLASVGVCFIDNDIWDDSAADMEVWTDTSLILVMSFIFGNQGFMYGTKECPPGSKINIFTWSWLLSCLQSTILPLSPHLLFVSSFILIVWTQLPFVIACMSQRHYTRSSWALTFVVGTFLVSSIFGLTSFHIFYSMRIAQNSLLTMSASSPHKWTSCWYNGGGAFRCPGQVSPQTCPPMKLSDLNDHMLHLQVNAIEKSTVKGYA